MVEFDWLIHYRCNYRCSYCVFTGDWDEVEKRNVVIPVERWIEAWQRMHEQYGEFTLIITGGEPTIFPGFAALIAKLNEFARISFDTNLSLSREALTGLLRCIPHPDKVFMGISFHPESADFEEFSNKARLLEDNHIPFRVHYVTYPPHLSRLNEFRERFMQNGFRFVPIPFRGTYRGLNYPEAFTDDEKELIYGVTEKIKASDQEWANRQVVQIESKNRLCQAGQFYARVDSDGTVYRCAHDQTQPPIGNILDAHFSLSKAPVTCTKDTCPCEFRWLVKD